MLVVPYKEPISSPRKVMAAAKKRFNWTLNDEKPKTRLLIDIHGKKVLVPYCLKHNEPLESHGRCQNGLLWACPTCWEEAEAWIKPKGGAVR